MVQFLLWHVADVGKLLTEKTLVRILRAAHLSCPCKIPTSSSIFVDLLIICIS